MHELFPAPSLLFAFVVASLILAITPGPAVFYIVTRSVTQGRAAGLASVAGVACGNLGNALGASLGLAALFAVSSLAFVVVKYCGAAYLIYLGFRALRRAAPMPDMSFAASSPRRLFVDGVLVALLNPKTTLFFAAFLPQFIDPTKSALVQVPLLGVLFVLIAMSTDVLYALLASTIGPRLARGASVARWSRYVGAGAFFGLGAFAALSQAPRIAR